MSSRVARVGVLVVASTAVLGCSKSPTVVEPVLEMVVASGDEQFGTPGQTLSNPLRAMVLTLAGRVPQVGVTVSWAVVAGDASIVGAVTSVTDSTGSAEIRLRLGDAVGAVEVEATAQKTNDPKVRFRAYTVDRPVLSDVQPAAAAPGSSVVLTGQNFSPDPEQNVVLFSGIRGRVTAASLTELTVVVPACLPARDVSVSVQLGAIASGARALSVGQGGTLQSLEVGEHVDVDDPFQCLGLPGGGEYLTVVYSASTIGAAKHPFQLAGASSAGPLAALGSRPGWQAAEAEETEPVSEPGGDPQRRLDEALRELESDAVRGRLGSIGELRLDAPAAAPPAVGHRRTFQVFASPGEFTEVTAVAQLVSDQAAFYLDEVAPAGGFTTQDLQELADRFDSVMHPTVTSVFGSESDIDDNQRVIILLSPAVNELTPRGSTGFVGGFFFGIDLLPSEPGSNGSEIFYALVPDPNGIHSDPRSRNAVMDVLPAILAHEFQHMVHFNQRILRLQAATAEAVWLSEGLAQYAEEAVALEYDALADPTSADLMRGSAVARSRRFLQGTDTIALIFSTGTGSLAERGASFLFTMYLEDQLGGDLLRRLTATTRTGVSNVEVEAARSWEDVLADWFSAVYLDGPGPETGRLVYPDVDLRGYLGSPFPLEPVEVGATDFSSSDSLWSSSAGYYIVSPPASGSTAVRVGGEAGGPSAPQAGLRMRVVRIS